MSFPMAASAGVGCPAGCSGISTSLLCVDIMGYALIPAGVQAHGPFNDA